MAASPCPGFCATVFADHIGHARQMVFAPNGVLYVNTWSGRYYQNDKPPAGGFLIALKDTKGDGHADVVERFGPGVPQGSAGGTGIAYYKGALYADRTTRSCATSCRKSGSIAPTGDPEVIVSGLPLPATHHASFHHRSEGRIFVDLGTATNSCQIAKPHAEFAGAPALHRARDPRRHLAL